MQDDWFTLRKQLLRQLEVPQGSFVPYQFRTVLTLLVWDEGLAQARRLARRLPSASEQGHALAEIIKTLAVQGRASDAASVAQEALALTSSLPLDLRSPAMGFIVEALAGLVERPKELVPVLNEIRKIERSLPIPSVPGLAEARARAGQFDTPLDLGTLIQVVENLARAGWTDEVVRLAPEVLRLSKESTLNEEHRILTTLASALVRVGKKELALPIALDAKNQVVRRKPSGTPLSVYALITTLAQLGKMDDTIGLYRFFGKHPVPESQADLVLLLAQAGEKRLASDAARDTLKSAWRGESLWDDAQTFSRVAAKFILGRMTELVLETVKEASAMVREFHNPKRSIEIAVRDRTYAYLALADVLALAGKREEAIALVREAQNQVKGRPSNEWDRGTTLKELACALARVGLLDEALAVDVDGRYDTRLKLTEVVAERGSADEARKLYAARVYPESSHPVILARCACLLGEQKRALELAAPLTSLQQLEIYSFVLREHLKRTKPAFKAFLASVPSPGALVFQLSMGG